MRVTQNITSQNSLYYIQQTRSRMAALEEKTASGLNINRPSDDPVTTRLLLEISERVESSEQYKSNISKANTWFKIADAAFSGMSETISDVRSKLAAASGTFSNQVDRDAAVSYLQLLKKTLVDFGNTEIGGVFIFGGTNNLTPPFKETTGDLVSGATTITNVANIENMAAGMKVSGVGVDDGTTITAVNPGPPPSINIDKPLTTTTTISNGTINVYYGNTEDVNTEINNNVSEAINIPGNHFLAAGAGDPYGSIDILTAIDQLVHDLQTNQLSDISSRIKALDEGNAQINSAQTELQSRMVRLDAANSMHDSIINTMKTLLSDKQTADYAALAVSLNQEKVAFEATLSSTAKIMQISLLDYL